MAETPSSTPGGVARSGPRAAYAASVWAFAFAAVSFYWAVGGTAGSGTIGREIEALALSRDPWMVATLWATAILKALAGLLALALARPWGRLLPRWMLLAAAWATGGLLTLYGLANLIQHGLMQAGVVHIPDALGAETVPWHLLLWDPVWLAGGILFCLAARNYGRRGA